MNLTNYSIPAQLPAHIFRAYDIRGIVDTELSADVVYALGLAIGSESLEQGEKTVITARDGRLSGPCLIAALQAGILATGCDVIDIGSVPTPLLYYATYTLPARSGVIVTGSHNPTDYNGLKIVIAGETLAEQRIQALYQRVIGRQFYPGQGKLTKANVIDDYIARIKADVHLAKPLKVVVDCGNGIAGNVAPALLKALGCDVVELYCEVDGRFPNHHPDPGQEKNLHDLINTVKQQQADVGIAFDGDGDRLGVVSNKGEIIWPDRQLMLFAIEILARNPQATILYDVKCTRYLAPLISQRGGIPLMWRTGHSLIKAKMRETNAALAGEMSGHIFFKDRWYGFDDGLYSAARLLEILAADSRSLSEIFAGLPDSINTPELKLPIAEENKFKFIDTLIAEQPFNEGEVTTIDGLRVDFADGWGLIRPSNTTSYLILRFEADTTHALQRIQQQFRERLLAMDASLALPF